MNVLRKSLFILAALLISASVSAQQFYHEGILYEVIKEKPSMVRVFKVNRCMKSFEIPSMVNDYSGQEYEVKSIGNEAFVSACSLVNLDLGEVKIIENGYMDYYEDGIPNFQGAFLNCRELAYVQMKRIRTIGDYAFYQCPALSHLILGEQLKSVGKFAFGECPSLKELQIYAARPPQCAPDAFMESCYQQAVLKVPAGKKPLYESAEVWKQFQHIEEMQESTAVDHVKQISDVQIHTETGHLRISNLHHGDIVRLFTADGRLLLKQIMDGTTFQCQVFPGQLYLLHIGKSTFKIRM